MVSTANAVTWSFAKPVKQEVSLRSTLIDFIQSRGYRSIKLLNENGNRIGATTFDTATDQQLVDAAKRITSVKKKLNQSYEIQSTIVQREAINDGVSYGPYFEPVFEHMHWSPGHYRWQGKDLRKHVLEDPHTTLTARDVSWMSASELVAWHTADHIRMRGTQPVMPQRLFRWRR